MTEQGELDNIPDVSAIFDEMGKTNFAADNINIDRITALVKLEPAAQRDCFATVNIDCNQLIDCYTFQVWCLC